MTETPSNFFSFLVSNFTFCSSVYFQNKTVNKPNCEFNFFIFVLIRADEKTLLDRSSDVVMSDSSL